jgi:hypothetical protein
MKNLIMALMALTLPLFWTSCDDGMLDYTKISGIVRDAGKGTPIPDAKVILYIKEGIAFNSGPGFPIDTIISDANGYYEYVFNHELGYIYSVQAEKTGYWEVEPTSDFIEGKETEVNLHIYPLAWLKIHVKNVNPFDENDLLTAYTNHLTGSSPENSYGINIDFIVIQEIKGNKKVPLIWWVTKNNIYQEFRDTIYCEGHKTTEYELFY